MSNDKGTYIPNADGAITVEEKGFFKLVSNHKAMDAFSKVLETMISGNKDLFRKEAVRRLSAAAPGASRVEFSDGKGGCVMVSTPDVSKAGNRKSLDAKLLAAVGSVIDLAGKLETVVKGSVRGALLDALIKLPKGQPVYVLTGDMVPWLESLFVANNMPVPETAMKLVAGEEDLTVTQETKLMPEAFTVLSAELSEMRNKAPEEVADKGRYEALQALCTSGVSSPTVNVR